MSTDEIFTCGSYNHDGTVRDCAKHTPDPSKA